MLFDFKIKCNVQRLNDWTQINISWCFKYCFIQVFFFLINRTINEFIFIANELSTCSDCILLNNNENFCAMNRTVSIQIKFYTFIKKIICNHQKMFKVELLVLDLFQSCFPIFVMHGLCTAIQAM